MSDTETKILDLAETLTQTRGFNGFSYIDLANEVGIKTASVHYYFKRKDDLAAALVERMHERHAEGFKAMEAEHERPQDRLRALMNYFQNYIAHDRFCLCGMMAAELQSVSPRVRKLVQAYFEDFRAWLKRQFELSGQADADRLAIRFLSALEGSLLLGRLSNDPKVIADTLKDFIET